MIAGIGVDVVDIARASRMLTAYGDRVLARTCTDAEAAYIRGKGHPAQHLASRLAAKEAVFKALAGSADARLIGWREIEVVPALEGGPGLVLHGRARARAAELGVTRLHLSLSHGDVSAVAMVVFEALSEGET